PSLQEWLLLSTFDTAPRPRRKKQEEMNLRRKTASNGPSTLLRRCALRGPASSAACILRQPAERSAGLPCQAGVRGAVRPRPHEFACLRARDPLEQGQRADLAQGLGGRYRAVDPLQELLNTAAPLQRRVRL